MKNIVNKIIRRFLYRKINGLIFGTNVDIKNSGEIVAGKNSSLGTINNKSVKLT